MNDLNIRKKIINILEHNGIYISDDDYEAELDVDSITFVTAIVDLEQNFSIEIDEQYFSERENLSVLKIEEMVTNGLEKTQLIKG